MQIRYSQSIIVLTLFSLTCRIFSTFPQSAYILSPPAKKHAHAAAVAAVAPVEKALPPPEKVELESVPEPVIVKDDEGVEADVSQSEKQSFVNILILRFL